MTAHDTRPPVRPAVERTPISTGVLKVVNPVFAALLTSPLHGVLDAVFRPRLLLLTVTGRRTGRRIPIVVGGHDADGALMVFTSRSWRVNLRGGADVEVTYLGRHTTGRAVLVEDPDQVADAYGAVIARIGWKAAARQLAVKANVGRAPTHAELAEAVAREHLAVIRVDLG